MGRIFSYELIVLIVLFASYAFWLVARGANPLHPNAWALTPILALIAVSTIATIIGVGIVGRFDVGPAGGAYSPAHMEDGKLVPSKITPPSNPP